MMKKKVIFTVGCLGMATCAWSLRAAQQTQREYTLRFPAIRETSQDYESPLISFDVRLQVSDNEKHLVPIAENLQWFSILNAKRKMDGWKVDVDQQGNATIFGFWRVGEANYRLELQGAPLDQGWKGAGRASMGTDPRLEEFPMTYSFQWSMVPKGTDSVFDLSKKVQYQGPAPEVVSVMVPSVEQMKRDAQNKPPLNVLTIKALSYETPEVRDQQVARLPKEAREYLNDKILADLSWEEIQQVPGVIMLVDFLVDLDVADQQRMANAYARDSSAKYLKGHRFEDLRDIPPAFLLVHCYPNLDKSRRQQIRKASKRFSLIIDELGERKTGPPVDIDDVIQKILAKMSKAEQYDFFAKSKKLKAFATRSQNVKLKELVPKDAR